jgi:hypothetical protein
VSADRPINADMPASEDPPKDPSPTAEEAKAEATPGSAAAEPKPASKDEGGAKVETESKAERKPKAEPKAKAERKPKAKAEPKPKRRRGGGRRSGPSIPLTLKLLGGLVVLALVFIVAALIGGSGGGKKTETPAPTPAPAANHGGSSSSASETSEELGYPGFATSNTTRIGGSEPAATAAGVSLAVYPSTTPAQRPAAVTVVDEGDWAGAVAGAVLMAEPVGAPLLYSGAEEMPDATSAAFEALQPAGSEATAGVSVFAIGQVALPGGLKITRVDSGDPASTAAQIENLRDGLFRSPPRHVIVAPADQPALAAPAAAWAARSGDPVLFAEEDSLPQPTAAALKRHSKVPVFVLGPASAISAKVVKEIAKIDGHVKRVSGQGPVANSLALARYRSGDFGWDVNDPGHGFVLANAGSPLSAAAAAPLSASGTWGPLLLTDDAGTLPAELRSYFLDVKPGYTTNPTRAFYNHVWVIGDQEAIDVNQQAEVNELAELAKIGGGE